MRKNGSKSNRQHILIMSNQLRKTCQLFQYILRYSHFTDESKNISLNLGHNHITDTTAFSFLWLCDASM